MIFILDGFKSVGEYNYQAYSSGSSPWGLFPIVIRGVSAPLAFFDRKPDFPAPWGLLPPLLSRGQIREGNTSKQG